MQKPRGITKRKAFQKAYNDLSRKQQKTVDEALDKFRVNPLDPTLHLHLLNPKTAGIWSISAGGDLRCLFIEIEGGVVFLALGTHSQLYG